MKVTLVRSPSSGLTRFGRRSQLHASSSERVSSSSSASPVVPLSVPVSSDVFEDSSESSLLGSPVVSEELEASEVLDDVSAVLELSVESELLSLVELPLLEDPVPDDPVPEEPDEDEFEAIVVVLLSAPVTPVSGPVPVSVDAPVVEAITSSEPSAQAANIIASANNQVHELESETRGFIVF